MSSKTCAACGVNKPHSEYHVNNTVRDGLRDKCKSCTAEYVRNWHLRKKYGLTHDEFLELLEGQNGACAICGDVKAEWHIDHSHASGHIRGILCNRCNIGLGYFRDSVESLMSAASYLLSREGVHDGVGSAS